MIDSLTFGVLLSAAVTLMAWTILYRETRFYTLAEGLMIGLYLGFNFAEGVRVLYNTVFVPLFVKGQWISDLTILLILGLLYYARLFKGKEWFSRVPMAILAGIATGLAVKGAVYSQIVRQVIIESLIGKTTGQTINNVLIVAITFTAMSALIYTHEQKGVLKISARIGRAGLMIAFGWATGTMLMSVISNVVGLIGILATQPGIYVTAIALLMLLVDIIRRTRTAQA